MGGVGSEGSVAMRPRYAPRPRACASAALFRGSTVLLVQRAEPVARGLWSLPGGRIEPGETAHAAAEREVREETGLAAALTGLVEVHDVFARTPDGRLFAHYVIAVFFGEASSGQPRAGGDAGSACFVPLDDLGDLPMTESALRIIRMARASLLRER